MKQELEEELSRLIDSAPSRAVGRPPTQEEIDEHRQFKGDVKSFLESLPQDTGLSYSAIMRKVKNRNFPSRPIRKNGKPRTERSAPLNRHEPSPAQSYPIDCLCILDFEATCMESSTPKPQEIIEFPTLLVNVKTGLVEDTFHHYVRPDVHTKLSEFCTDLTGIHQSTVDNAISLQEALTLHKEWLYRCNIVSVGAGPKDDQDQRYFAYVTCGDWDLKTCLPSQLAFHGLKVPPHFDSWINLKWPFEKMFRCRAKGMTNMLDALEMKLEGRHHSGIDDCRNISRICANMLENGWVPKSTSGLGQIGTRQFWKLQRGRPWPCQDDHQPFKMMYLVRHGQSEGQVARGTERTNSDSLKDCGLTEYGELQAKLLPSTLGQEWDGIELVVSSPLKRALHTTLLGFPGCSIQVHYDLAEFGRQIPENSARPMDEILRELQSVVEQNRWQIDSVSLKPNGWPHGSSEENHKSRIRAAFRSMFSDYTENIVAVVCHYNVICAAIGKSKSLLSPENAVPIKCKLLPDGQVIPL